MMKMQGHKFLGLRSRPAPQLSAQILGIARATAGIPLHGRQRGRSEPTAGGKREAEMGVRVPRPFSGWPLGERGGWKTTEARGEQRAPSPASRSIPPRLRQVLGPGARPADERVAPHAAGPLQAVVFSTFPEIPVNSSCLKLPAQAMQEITF